MGWRLCLLYFAHYIVLCWSPTWENWMALQERQPGEVWVQSVVAYMCGFRWRSGGWWNRGVGSHGEERRHCWGVYKCRSEGKAVLKVLFCRDLTIAQCCAVSVSTSAKRRRSHEWMGGCGRPLLVWSPTPQPLHRVTEKLPWVKLSVVCIWSEAAWALLPPTLPPSACSTPGSSQQLLEATEPPSALPAAWSICLVCV